MHELFIACHSLIDCQLELLLQNYACNVFFVYLTRGQQSVEHYC